MAITPAPDTAPAAVLGAARGLVLEACDRLPASWSDDDLVEGMSAVQLARGALDALEVAMLAEVDVREIPRKRLCWASTADWFTHLAGGFRRDGRRRVRHARLMASDYTDTLAAVRDGLTSMPQAGVIAEAVETLPTNPALRAQAEQVLLKQTRTLTATELTRAGRHIAAVVDPAGEERAVEAALDREERAAHLGRFLTVVGDGAGGVRIKGYGSTEDGEIVRAALLPLTKPAPAVDPDDPTRETEKDPRDAGARMWDALVATAQHALDTEFPPESHGARPRVAVTTTLEKLRTGIGEACPTETGLELSVAAVRRLSCDADIIPGVLGLRRPGPRRRPRPPPRHGRDLDRPGPPRPALRLPRLHSATLDVPRPPHHPLGRRRHDVPGQPRAALRRTPPRRPPHPLAGPPRPRRRTRVPTPAGRPRPHTRMDQTPAPARVRARYLASTTVCFRPGPNAGEGRAMWQARMIAPDAGLDAAPILRKSFALEGEVRRATLHLTALGVVEASINGTPVGDEVLAPGWTSYEWRLRVRAHDVTALVAEQNELRLLLGNGWYRGRLGFHGNRNLYGDELAGFAQLEVEYADGRTEAIGTDATWRAGASGITAGRPVRRPDDRRAPARAR